jgi:steroid delta-isomerase-like uncharacterized protein
MKLAAPFALAACFTLGSCTSRPAVDRDGRAANVALGRRVFTEIYGGGKVSLVDELYIDDFVDDSPGGGKGRDLIKEAVADFHKAFPDLSIDIEDVFAVDDNVVVRYSAHGTQTGPYGQIPPTGKVVTVRGITIFQIVNGKITTEWTEYDRLGVLRQLGIVPS